jgi:DUF4097 and DUF4098 domain-containing protein YvlB
MRVILVAFAAFTLVGCDFEDFDSARFRAQFHYTLKPAERLNIDTFNGDVEIAGWDDPSIEITGEKYASTQEKLDSIKIDVQEFGGAAEIKASRPDSFRGNQGVRFLVRAPRKTIVERLSSSNSGVRIHDMNSDARIHTSNGSVRVENVSGNVNAETSNGGIDLDSVTGNLNLRTSNGRIRAEEISGQCEANTSNGAVTLRFKDGPDGPTRIRSSNGSVEVSLAKSPKNSLRAETSNGSITIEMPPNTSAHLNADTSHSSVSSDFEVMERQSGEKDKNHLEGNIGSGGAQIELATRNGGIHIRKSTASTN